MDFGLSAEQEAIRDSVRRLARGELAPGYLERGRSEEFPWEIHRRLGELGVLGLLAGPEHNPLGAEDYVTAGLVVEELAYGDFNVANAVIPVLLVSALISAHARERVRERWLAPLVAGEEYVAFGLTEPGAGSDAAALRTEALADGDGYLISGEKTSVTMYASSGAMVVTARTRRPGGSRDGAGPGGAAETGGERGGVSAFLVELDQPGITTGPIPDTGWKPMGRGSVHFDQVHVPADALMGPEGGAFAKVLNGFDFTRPLLALTGIGSAQAALDQTAEYVRVRQAFGSPLAAYEGVSFPLAEHVTALEAARLLCYSALWRRNQGIGHTAEAAMAKWYGPLAASAAVKECLLLHGHYGYASETGLEQRLRDVMAVEIADGTAQIQKIIIARERYGKEFLPYRRG